MPTVALYARYRKDDSKTPSLSQTAVSQDLAQPAPTPALEPGESPLRKHCIKQEVKVWPKETFGVVIRSGSKKIPMRIPMKVQLRWPESMCHHHFPPSFIVHCVLIVPIGSRGSPDILFLVFPEELIPCLSSNSMKIVDYASNMFHCTVLESFLLQPHFSILTQRHNIKESQQDIQWMITSINNK